MLVNSDSDVKLTDIQYDAKKDSLSQLLKEHEQDIWKHKLPVIIVFEGLCTSGKDEIVRKTVNILEPLTYRVFSAFQKDTVSCAELGRYWNEIPMRGRMVIYENSWYSEAAAEKLTHKLTRSELKERIRHIKIFERQLCDDGYIIIKLFLFTSEKESDERYEKMLSDDSSTAFSKKEKVCINAYRKYDMFFERAISETATDYSPWYVIDSSDMKMARIKALEAITHHIQCSLTGKKEGNAGIVLSDCQSYVPEISPVPLLSQIKLSKSMSDKEYDEEIEYNQKLLVSYQKLLSTRKISLILGFEGWDASGKGGAIKRIIEELSPSMYEVYPVCAPDNAEASRHYLWRFYNKFKAKGKIIIFDRTWYGRVLVERVEGLTTERRWSEAFREINEFEESLCGSDNILIKFWVHVDKDEQLRRFNARQNDKDKQWKIKEEDWRNRSKWDSYLEAAEEMMRKTSTTVAPWNIIEGNDKKYARVKILRIINNTLREKLN